jgi:hypothetical protein
MMIWKFTVFSLRALREIKVKKGWKGGKGLGRVEVGSFWFAFADFAYFFSSRALREKREGRKAWKFTVLGLRLQALREINIKTTNCRFLKKYKKLVYGKCCNKTRSPG